MNEAGSRAGFREVDDDHDAAGLVAALDQQAGLPAIERLRATALDRLGLRSGDRVLDAGSGTGDMTRRLAAATGDRGRAVGVDASEVMVDAARRRTAGSPQTPAPEFHLGDVTALDAPAAIFDATYCERVFQHLAHPEAALAELVRVTRPGGRIVVVDTDWGMHAIAGADRALTERVVDAWARHTPSGWSGRHLPALFAAAGVVDVVVTTDTITTAGPDAATAAGGSHAEPFSTMAAVARARGALTSQEADRWLAQLARARATGSFLWAVTLVLVAGTRPPS